MRIDFYTHPHKKQRNMLFALSQKVSEADFTDPFMIKDINDDLTFIINDLKQHVFNEETFVHPLLIKKMPRIERSLHEEHETLEQFLDDLEKNYAHLKELTPSYKKCQEQGLEFYRTLNQFIANYLIHINEEEYLMPQLWEISLQPELTGMMIAFQTHTGIENGEQWLNDHLPSMNINEQQLLFNTTQLLAPEPIFITMRQLGEKILGRQKWENIFQKS